jgi:hypothetical protein
MWVQVIQGKTKDPAGLRKQLDRWREEMRPNAKGFLGSTGGVTDDGQFITVARFENKELAMENSNNPQQTEWWNETSKYIEDPVFHDCDQVDTWMGGGTDEAGFVQIMQYKTSDFAKLQEMMGQGGEEAMHEFRPDMLGGTTAYDGDTVTQVIYFTSEAEAREGEKKETPPEMKEWDQAAETLMQDVKFIDLRDPDFVS